MSYNYNEWVKEEMKKNVLVGKTITGITVDKDGDDITFNIKDGKPITAVCYGDCCSTTWIEGVELPALGFPATVIEVDNLDMPDLGDQPGCDVMAYYGFKIVTDKGEIIIDYRNNSNGYYGGNLEWPRAASA